MDAHVIIRWTKTSSFRGAACAALLSLSLGACSSVPTALNPVKWYEKTTDFFSGDRQAADMQTAQGGKNNGLSADPAAPAPTAVPVQSVTIVGKGLSSDQVASNYASPPIERQGAPRSVLQPFVPKAVKAAKTLATPPRPVARPSVSVASSPLAAPVAPLPVAPVAAVPVAVAKIQPLNFKRISMAGAPPPPKFNVSPSARAFPSASPFGEDAFETVVISSNGMATVAPARLKLPISSAQTGARPPNSEMTVGGTASRARAGSRIRAATINFANNSSSLDARDRSILGAVIQLQRERGGRVVVVGHASSRTKDMDYITHKMVNFQISIQRATTIGNALKDLGLKGENLEVQAVSDQQPLYTEVMPSGEAGNRRVEIYLAL